MQDERERNRCNALTKAMKRCKNKRTKNDENFCAIHRNMNREMGIIGMRVEHIDRINGNANAAVPVSDEVKNEMKNEIGSESDEEKLEIPQFLIRSRNKVRDKVRDRVEFRDREKEMEREKEREKGKNTFEGREGDEQKLIEGLFNLEKENEECNAVICMYKCTRKKEYGEKFCKIHKGRFKLDKPPECPICYEILEDCESPLSCGHWIHLKCLRQLENNECPVCRTAFSERDVDTKTNNDNLIYNFLVCYSVLFLLLSNELIAATRNKIDPRKGLFLIKTIRSFNMERLFPLFPNSDAQKQYNIIEAEVDNGNFYAFTAIYELD